MKRILILLLLNLIFVSMSAMAAEKKPELFTQKDAAMLLLKQIGWDAGLPKETTDRDILAILTGKRTFRYEAENAFNVATDNVSVSEYEIYGKFSGKGWLSGVSTSTVTHFTILLPVAGEYTVKSVLKGNGFVWDMAGKKLTVGTKDKKLNEVEVGTLTLPAGIVQISVTMPPEGGIDYFTISGADYAPVTPFKGWRFKEQLNAGTLAEIIVSATGKSDKLPIDNSRGSIVIPVTSLTELPEFTSLVDTSYLGKFSSKKWLRASYRGSQLQFPFNVEKLGLYDVALQILSETVVGELNGTSFKLPGKPYLEKILLGQYRLDPGISTLNLSLPPMGGIDAIHLLPRNSSPEAFMKLIDLPGKPERPIAAKEAEELIKKFTPKSLSRK